MFGRLFFLVLTIVSGLAYFGSDNQTDKLGYLVMTFSFAILMRLSSIEAKMDRKG